MESSIKLINGFAEQIISALHEPSKANWLVFFLEAAFFLYLSSIELDVLHRLGAAEKHHLFYDVHLLVDINGFVKSPIIWKVNSLINLWLRETFRPAMRKLLKRAIIRSRVVHLYR